MPSWNDGETSDESLSLLSEEHDYGPYCPPTTFDMEWYGMVDNGKILCMHNKPAERMVAFHGQNTGRRYFGCAERGGDSCGVVDWVDPQWPAALKRALIKVWDMYEKINIANIVKEELCKLAEEKKQLQEKYEMNIKLTNDFYESMEIKVHKKNYQKIMTESEVEMLTLEAQKEMAKFEKENIMLEKEVKILKHIHAFQVELIMNSRKDETEDVQLVKEEKKKLEYAIADLLKDGEVNKSKIKRIKAICDE